MVGLATEAIQRMLRALQEYTVEGIVTNIPFHRWALKHPRFIAGDIDTGFIPQEFHGLPFEEDALAPRSDSRGRGLAAYHKDQALAGALPQGATRGRHVAWRGADGGEKSISRSSNQPETGFDSFFSDCWN